MKKFNLLILCLLSICLFSCKEEFELPTQSVQNVNENSLLNRNKSNLSNNDALIVGKSFMRRLEKNYPNSKLKNRLANKEWSSANITSINDSLDMPLMYVLNFKEGGFCIVSATKHIDPILAYSENGSFDLNENLNSGTEMWISETIGLIDSKKNLSEEEFLAIKMAWMPYEDYTIDTDKTTKAYVDPEITNAFNQKMGSIRSRDGDGFPLSAASGLLASNTYSYFQSLARSTGSPEEYTIVEIIDQTINTDIGPLLNTNWHQEAPFANKVPKGKYAGCTAIAAGQIMNYHKHPNRFNWDRINNYNLFEDIQNLMVDLGKSFKMEYKDDGSGAYIYDVKVGLELYYQYSVTEADHIPADVGRFITTHKSPVYMTGKATNAFLGLIYKDGHAWVCDGYRTSSSQKAAVLHCLVKKDNKYIYENAGQSTYSTQTAQIAYFHQNWGWGSYYNGWYGANVAQPTSNTLDFKYARKNLYILKNKTL